MKFWSFGRTKSLPVDLSGKGRTPSDIFLRAYKPAQNFTLAERTERIMQQQRFISDELKIWTWDLSYNNIELDIRDNACYDLIYKRAKKGMNTKRADTIRYQPGDIPDLQSTCFFCLKNSGFEHFYITHQLGWNGNFSKSECINIDGFVHAPESYSPSIITRLMDRIIDEYKPKSLCITSSNYHLKIAKRPDSTPWTGWITYLDNSVPLPKKYPDFCEVQTKANGTLFQVCEEMFNDTSSKHTDASLKLEKWFRKNGVRV
ncbi:MAG TPA: hypothetical protein VHS53_05445 [Mucilaginibacter sp.]|jgi:hypothetical protein|nr:hypothetical protein [Mucilaginibacter sp.]